MEIHIAIIAALLMIIPLFILYPLIVFIWRGMKFLILSIWGMIWIRNLDDREDFYNKYMLGSDKWKSDLD